jgi:hypothetical protein
MDLGEISSGGASNIGRNPPDISLSKPVNDGERDFFAGSITVFNQDRSQSIKAGFEGSTAIAGNGSFDPQIGAVGKQVLVKTAVTVKPDEK